VKHPLAAKVALLAVTLAICFLFAAIMWGK